MSKSKAFQTEAEFILLSNEVPVPLRQPLMMLAKGDADQLRFLVATLVPAVQDVWQDAWERGLQAGLTSGFEAGVDSTR